MAHWEFQAVLLTLKRVLKAKKITYEDLAKRLSLSLPTVKRLFAGHEPSFGRIVDICNVIGVSFFDLVHMSHKASAPRFTLTPEQEETFVGSPDLYAFFRLLHSGQAPAELASENGLNPVDVERYLRSLEDLRLLDRLPAGRLRLLNQGQIQWQQNGPMRRQFIRDQNHKFLESLEQESAEGSQSFHVVECELHPETFRHMTAELEDLSEKYRGLANRDLTASPSGSLMPVRWLIAAGRYRTDWRQYLSRDPSAP